MIGSGRVTVWSMLPATNATKERRVWMPWPVFSVGRFQTRRRQQSATTNLDGRYLKPTPYISNIAFESIALV